MIWPQGSLASTKSGSPMSLLSELKLSVRTKRTTELRLEKIVMKTVSGTNGCQRWGMGLVVFVFGSVMVGSGALNASTIFVENFDGLPTGVWADSSGTNGGWRVFGAINDGSQIENSSGAPSFYGSGNVGYMDVVNVTPHIWNRFNGTSASNIATPKIWLEFFAQNDFNSGQAFDEGWGFRIPKTNDIGATRVQVGFLDLNPGGGSGGQLFVSGAQLDTVFSDFTLADGDWAHVVAEITLNHDPSNPLSSIKVYAKQVSAGDNSALTNLDILDLNGSSTANFIWDGAPHSGTGEAIVDAIVIQNDVKEGSSTEVILDDIKIWSTSPIVDVSIPGDFDSNDRVDGLDFLKWQRGESPIPSSQSDLSDWRAYYGFGGTLTGSVGVVPEPSTLCLLLGSCTTMLLCRRIGLS